MTASRDDQATSGAGPSGRHATTSPTVTQLLRRGVARRCPLCGRDPMFDGWFSLRRQCSACGFSFERDEEDDYWLGPFLLNFIVTEVVFAVLLLVILVATWPSPPWWWLIWIGAIQMTVTPIVFYPFSKALWLIADLIFRPPTATDFETRAPEEDGP